MADRPHSLLDRRPRRPGDGALGRPLEIPGAGRAPDALVLDRDRGPDGGDDAGRRRRSLRNSEEWIPGSWGRTLGPGGSISWEAGHLSSS